MAIRTPPHLHSIFGLMVFLPLTDGDLAAVFALPGLLIGQRVVDPRRPHDPPSRLALSRASLQPTIILSPLSPSPPRRSKHSPSATTHPCPSLLLQARVFISLRSFQVTSQVQIPIGCNLTSNTMHLLLGDHNSHELQDLYTIRTHVPGLPHNPW
jgi:hypothetical protein